MLLCRDTVTIAGDATKRSWRGAYASYHGIVVGVYLRLAIGFVRRARGWCANDFAARRERRSRATRERSGCGGFGIGRPAVAGLVHRGRGGPPRALARGRHPAHAR